MTEIRQNSLSFTVKKFRREQQFHHCASLPGEEVKDLLHRLLYQDENT